MTKGDMIKCVTKDDAVKAMRGLAELGIRTDFVYKGDEIWLEVTEEENK